MRSMKDINLQKIKGKLNQRNIKVNVQFWKANLNNYRNFCIYCQR